MWTMWIVKAGTDPYLCNRKRSIRVITCLGESVCVHGQTHVDETTTSDDSSAVACSEEQFFSGVIEGVELVASSRFRHSDDILPYPFLLLAQFVLTENVMGFCEKHNFCFGKVLPYQRGIPLLNGDYSEFGDIDEDSDYAESDGTTEKPTERTRREDTKQWSVKMRRKRDTVVVMTRDETTNSTTIREFNFLHIITNSTCQMIGDLRASTRYIVYVTARNDYGTSVPSVRSIASTNAHMVKNNESIPDVMSGNQCCKVNKVSEFCRTKMCNVETSPNAFATVSIATTCRVEWPKVSPCLADGRNHTDCCRRKGVQEDCLSICAGSTETLESHPSPPINVTVASTSDSSVEISWEEPNSNAHLVETYTLLIRKTEHGAPIREVCISEIAHFSSDAEGGVLQVHNAVSPHTEIGLDPDSEYLVSVRSNSEKGQSLPSTSVLFYTKSNSRGVCLIGEPLLISGLYGRQTKKIIDMTSNKADLQKVDRFSVVRAILVRSVFSVWTSKTKLFVAKKTLEIRMTTSKTAAVIRKYHPIVSQLAISTSHFQNAVDNFNDHLIIISGDLNKWVQCASEGRDHSRCCEMENVPKECLTGCRHPFQVADSCFDALPRFSTCFSAPHLGLPQPVQRLKVTLITSDSALLIWQDADYSVTGYKVENSKFLNPRIFNALIIVVKLFANDALVSTAETTAESYRLENLSSSTEYRARVISKNEHGDGPQSFNVTFTTLPLRIADGDRPKAPDGLSVVWNYGNRVNITWNPVTLRMDERPVTSVVTYTLYYVEVEKTGQWTTMQTNSTWLIIKDLTRDALYSMYVMATEKEKTSRSSSVITVLAQPDLLGLPEPVMKIVPDHADGVYMQNDKILINCSVPVDITKGHLNIDLSAGTHSASNDHGVSWVAEELEADSSVDTVTCAVTDTDGRQNVAMRHLLVRFGPVAKMDKEKVRAFDDQSADLSCTVKGFPSPAIRFEIEGKAVKGETRVKVIAMNTYRATLHLVISRQLLPVNPRLILSCCEKEQIEGDCLQACSIGKVPSSIGACSQYAASLLKCASDVVDHSDCCALRGVSNKCLPLCSGDSFSTDVDCTPFAVTIMECFVKGREGSPKPVQNVEYEIAGNGKLKLRWEDSDASDTYRYYAVYYKKRDEEGEYKIEKMVEHSVELNVEPDTSYDIGIISANAFGHSPLVFLDVPSTSIGIIYLGRRRDLPAPFGRLVRRQQSTRTHATVAFENPAYVAGHEVEIRGLGSGRIGNGVDAEWQSQDLQASAGVEEYRNGMRYAKLEST
uniref:Fibronectin type-III domain-containing protein n=1 Tax=Angiostrongylus cantonensis TaxID=6313 RepID=A0A158P8X5_ANGCA